MEIKIDAYRIAATLVDALTNRLKPTDEGELSAEFEFAIRDAIRALNGLLKFL